MTDAVSRFLGRLRVSRKLMLIYLLDLTAVIYVCSVLVNEQLIAIRFAQKELIGNHCVATVREAMLGMVQWQRAAMAPTPAQLIERLGQAQAQHAQTLGIQALSQTVQEAVRSLANSPPEQQWPKLRQALQHSQALLTRIGNQSNLILDPDLDSYYTMSLTLLRYPALTGLLSDLSRADRYHAHRTDPTAAGAATTHSQELLQWGQLETLIQAMAADRAEAAAAMPVAQGALFLSSGQALQQALQALLASQLPSSEAQTGPSPTTPALSLAALQTLQTTWVHDTDMLDRLLQARIDRLYQRLWLHLGTALTLLLAILGLVSLVARSIAKPLAALAHTADQVRRTGDHTLRAHCSSHDEIGQLVVAFNHMLDRLIVEQETQKELAASARAAEVQRRLVASMPIALVVTAVPNHEVLHANPPAAQWLDGSGGDPWALGMEPALRARFFQQLHDQGAVDQFEVPWRLPGHATDHTAPQASDIHWAVLSARLVEFEGHAAVLTAFTPIQQLKQMERRLELWAKVFEASGEGILILDARQRVLTLNRAMVRTSGYEPVDVFDQPVGPFFFDTTAHNTLPQLWRDVGHRGHWSGELTMRRRDGQHYPAWVMASGVRLPSGELSHLILVSIDITDRKESEARIRYLAEHDVLTGLPNRSQCHDRLNLAVQQARYKGEQVAVIFIDLDRFKDVNDALGHHVGDALLRSVATRLGNTLREGDAVCRLGGDEFILILGAVHDRHTVAQLIEQRIVPAINLAHEANGESLQVCASIGVAMYPQDAVDTETLLRHADTAMYQAKADGRNAVRFFTADMTESAQRRRQTEADLRTAIEQQQFELFWQPRVEAQQGRLCGVEGLIRWRHPVRGLVPPGDFIPIAEETGLIVPIGHWVIDEACRQAAQWRTSGLPPMGVAINVSALQLRDHRLSEDVAAALARHQLPAEQFELELTESMVMNDAEATLQQLHALRALGVKLAIDDFGTGYSSLAYLTRLPIDRLKIDRSFVHRMLSNPHDKAIITAIISLGHTLGLRIVAEGVEQEHETTLLQQLQCDELQGFFYGRPMPAAALEQWAHQRLSAP